MENGMSFRIMAMAVLLSLSCVGDDVELKIPATDSASAGTAIATGMKTDPGNISWAAGDPGNGALPNINDLLQGSGWSVGIVTTVPFSHATPACFVAHNPSREHYRLGSEGFESLGPGISEEILLVSRPAVVIGGGHPLSGNPEGSEDFEYISQRVYTDFVSGMPGWVFVERTPGEDAAELLSSASMGLDPDSGICLFGLFGGPGGNFDPPVPSDDGTATVRRATLEDPLLAEAALSALEILSRDDQGFFLMIEQGDIDWANHHNDYVWLMGTMWDLEMCVRAVAGFADTSSAMDDSNTMIIVTSDHSNGYLEIDLAGPPERGDLPLMTGSDPDYSYPEGGISYGCTEHTNQPVSFYARYPEGLQALVDSLEGSFPSPGGRILDNTHIHSLIMGAVSSDPPVNRIILIIADGMNLQHEHAAGLYLYGDSTGCAWMREDLFPYRNICTTWDIATYDRYALSMGREPFSSGQVDPLVGFDPDRASRDYYLEPLPLR